VGIKTPLGFQADDFTSEGNYDSTRFLQRPKYV
jgi:hypothetical protein